MNESNHDMNHEPPQADAPEVRTPRKTSLWLLVIAALVLLVYPATRWLMRSGNTPTAPAAPPAAGVAGMAELQTSFVHFQAGRYEEAVAAATAALKANPTLADAYNNIAVSYLALKRYDEAIHAAEEALRLQPTNQLAKNNLAWIRQEKAKNSGAAPPAVPTDATGQATTLLNQSLQHAQAARFPECVQTAEQAVKLDPNMARAFNNLGFCQASLQRWDDAIRNTETAIRLDPTLQLARNNLAWMQQEKAKTGSKPGR